MALYLHSKSFVFWSALDLETSWILDFGISDAHPIMTVKTVEEPCEVLRAERGVGEHSTHARGTDSRSLPPFLGKVGCGEVR